MIMIKETMVAKMQSPEYKPTHVKQQKVHDKRNQQRGKEGTKQIDKQKVLRMKKNKA